MDRRTRLIVYYLVSVVSVLSGFVILYNYGMATWEGRPQPLYRSLEVVIQTVTTVGYGGDAPWSSPQMNYLVSLMALSGLVLIFAALPVLVVPLFEDAFRTTAPSSVHGIDGHVVLCNYGAREEVLIDELTGRGVEYVIVEDDREVANDLYTSGYTVMFGDPESDVTLRSARVEHADTLIANIDDETNLSILLSAREVNPDVRTISLTEDPTTADYHRYAGANHVLTPRRILGEQLAGMAVGTFDPEAVDAVEIDEDFDIAEFPLQSGSELIGRTIADSGVFERAGADIIGVWIRGDFQSPPPPNARFDARSVLVATGSESDLDRLKEMTLSEGRHRRGDVIVAGIGVVGQAIMTALTSAGFEYTTIDLSDTSTVDVVGDATERDVLREAGITDAGTIVLALPDDTAAIFATFAIRELNPGIEIIARANDHESVSKLYRAGADYVLSLASVSGRMLASIVLDEEILSPGTQLKLIRTTAPGAVGQSIADADIRRRTGCTVVAAERNGSVVTHPGASFVIEPRDELVVAGTDKNITRFQTEFA
ncbi:trk active potasium channel [Halorubrum aidingense JCM 13560]|uniref:Trk active potasium channel n=1 Tax=Halorubrum aidingense JCM 13560 TaxID=1230454 RepID=M0PL64_9EURY|nr:NAD-binding protein [Halorubrum aidingense]EMA70767.1 trk active potasium channel [Halorubrum aidingense JCM 13560]